MNRRNPAAIPDRIILERIHFESVSSPIPDFLSRPATLILAAILVTTDSGAEKNSENRVANAQLPCLQQHADNSVGCILGGMRLLRRLIAKTRWFCYR